MCPNRVLTGEQIYLVHVRARNKKCYSEIEAILLNLMKCSTLVNTFIFLCYSVKESDAALTRKD